MWSSSQDGFFTQNANLISKFASSVELRENQCEANSVVKRERERERIDKGRIEVDLKIF